MLEQDGLTAPAGPHDGSYLTSRAIEIDAIEDLLTAKAPPQLAHHDRAAVAIAASCHRVSEP